MLNTKKTLMAASVALAVAAPLLAQAQTSVQVYGRLYPQINHYRLTGATAAGAPGSSLGVRAGGADVRGTNMESPNARLGFRGTEDLGSGLKALFQLESSFGVDTGQLGNANVLFGRDSFVGLAGGFGTVRLGNMDTVYKNLGDTLSFLGVSSGNFMSSSNILSKPGIGGSGGSSFHLRRGNSVIYETPEIAGFQALADYSFGEVAGNFRQGSVISAGVKYENGPLYAAVAHERHRDMFGASANVSGATAAATAALRNTTGAGATLAIRPGASSTDEATRLTVQYKITGDTRVEANIARLEYDETGPGTFRNYKTRTWALGAEHRMGPVTLAASYGQAAAGSCTLSVGACSTSGLDGKMLNIGAGYSLSKRTLLYTVYSRLNNGASARYSNTVQAPDPVAGQDISQFALGVSHSF